MTGEDLEFCSAIMASVERTEREMRPTPLIGLHGPIACGKDTVAAHLKTAHAFWTFSFAGPVKDMLVQGLGLPRDAFIDREKKEQPIDWLGVAPRQLMRTLGTEWGRALVHNEIWILKLGRSISLVQAAMRDRAAIVVTDVRYPNEAEFIRRCGGSIWHIERDLGRPPEHSSDQPLEPQPGDSRLRNNGTLADLQALVDRALLGSCRVTA